MRATSAHFSVSVSDAAPGGCAVVVPKKAARLSVSRHLLKRRILAILRPWHDPRLRIVVYARPGSESLPFPALRTELESVLARAVGHGMR